MSVWKRRVWRSGVVGLCAIAWGTLVVGGCSEQTRYRVLSVLFEGVPKPGQKTQWELVKHQTRRPPWVRPTPTPKPVVKVEKELPADWLEQLVKTLPRDYGNYPDMVAALDGELIKPSPGPEDGAVPQPVLDKDIKLIPKGKLKLIFSHKIHTNWLACSSCHPKLFKEKTGADEMSMADVSNGKFCGVCHGKVAFSPKGDCKRCHIKFGKKQKPTIEESSKKPPNLMKGEIHFERIDKDPNTKQILPATFPHLPHRVRFRCYACHDRIFAMKPEPDKVSMAQIEDRKACGICHNGKVAFGVTFTTCVRCHR